MRGAANRVGLHGAFALPILRGGDVLGVMEFFSRDIRQPDAALLDTMMTAGAQIGLYVARKWAADELETFFTLSLDLLCVASLDGYFLRLNPAWTTCSASTTRSCGRRHSSISSIPTIAPRRSTRCRR